MICCPIAALCASIRRLITDYRNCRSGFPDLTVWNDEKKLLAVCLLLIFTTFITATIFFKK